MSKLRRQSSVKKQGRVRFLELEAEKKVVEGKLEIANELCKKLGLEVEEMGFDVKSSEEAYGKIKELLERT